MRKCRRQTGLTVGTVMERSHTPLSTWFWAAYLVATQTPGMSAVQFQRQLGSRVTRQPFRSCTNSAPEWSARTKIVSVGARMSMSR